jgi:hypothetical protein
MGPALETFLTVVFIFVLAVGALAYLGRPVWHRVWQFLKGWYQADQMREEALRRQAEYRKEAEKEVDETTYATPESYEMEETPAPAPAKPAGKTQKSVVESLPDVPAEHTVKVERLESEKRCDRN